MLTGPGQHRPVASSVIPTPTVWTLDGEPFEMEDSDLCTEDRVYAEQMTVGDKVLVGGGAFATFVLARVR